MTHIRNAWYVSAWAHDIVPERPMGVRFINEPIVIWRNAAGDLAAFEDRCVHRLAPLSLGRREGERVRCTYHGLLHDRTGRVVEIPGQDRIPGAFRVRTFPVAQRDGCVWIWMGDGAVADENLIPPVIGMDNPDCILGCGQLDFAADARLINDNLLGLSHVEFPHAESARLIEARARARPKFPKRERSVRTEWWIRGEPLAAGEPGDTYSDEAVRARDTLMVLVQKAFAEDSKKIDAQQQIIDSTRGWRMTPIGSDRGVALLHQIVEKLAGEESADRTQRRPTRARRQ